MNRDIQSALSAIQHYRPVDWEQIPDLGLYMDQVITFITRMYEPLYGEDIHGYLSPSMINNYVKSKLIPRPTGKKYSREQIALLTMIVALKQTSSMEDIRRMLTLQESEVDAVGWFDLAAVRKKKKELDKKFPGCFLVSKEGETLTRIR